MKFNILTISKRYYKKTCSFFKNYLPWIISGLLIIWLFYTLNVLHIGLGIFVKKIFWTPSQGFAWTSLTGLAALLGLFINIWSQNKSVKAQVISKERTRWLSNHKIIMAQYISDAMECIQYLQVLKEHKTRSQTLNSEDITRVLNRIEEKLKSIQKNRFLLLLELTSHNEENKKFLDEIEKTYFEIDSVHTQVMLTNAESTDNTVRPNMELLLTKATVQIHTLLITASHYYQSVWIQIKE